MQLQDYVNDTQELLHDAIGVSWPIPRVISRINDARLFTALDMKCVRKLITGVQLIQGQETYNLAGAVVGANVLTGGSNYGGGATVPVMFGPPPAGGTPALGFGNLTSGQVTSITMTQWGSGYVIAPIVTVLGVGTGATASAVTLINQMFPITITYLFNNIRTMLRYLPFTQFQAYARVLGNLFSSTPGAWTYHQESGLVYIQAVPNQVYISEWDMVFMPVPLVNLTDLDTDVIDPWNRAPQHMAAALLSIKDQDAGRSRAAFHLSNYERFIPKIAAGVGSPRVPNIYNRSVQRMVAR